MTSIENNQKPANSSCCRQINHRQAEHWISGYARTSMGDIPVVRTELPGKDILGGWKVRWNIKRRGYKIKPGLYGVGNPDQQSRVLVTANYKLTFDRLRRELSGLNLWLLVLDTNGINVWCAAGKGTFGTRELVKRIKMVGLDRLVSHRQIIVPQLGAVGVAAHLVTKATGFKVVYGPIRAKDLPTFLQEGLEASKAMRRVEFNWKNRLALIPVELIQSLKLIPAVFLILFFLALLRGNSNPGLALLQLLPFVGALLAGTVIFPVLLPWLPGRAFALKGWLLGIFLTAGYILIISAQALAGLMLILLLPPVTAFLALNFTGCTPFTSLSGVSKEIKFAYPLFGISLIGGVTLKVVFGL
jgi:hypothetical protein